MPSRSPILSVQQNRPETGALVVQIDTQLAGLTLVLRCTL